MDRLREEMEVSAENPVDGNGDSLSQQIHAKRESSSSSNLSPVTPQPAASYLEALLKTPSVPEETTLSTIYEPESSDSALVKDGDCQAPSSTSPKVRFEGIEKLEEVKEETAQAGDDLRQMAVRLSSVEKAMRRRNRRERDDDDSDVNSRPRSTIPGIHRVKWSEFKNKKVEEKQVYAIEVLEGPAKYWYQLWRESDDFHTPRKENSGETSIPRARTPDRIRINSLPLTLLLAYLSDSPFPNDEAIVLLRPFKLLVYYEKRIRETLVELEHKWAESDRKESTEQAGESSQRETDEDSLAGEKNLEPKYEDIMNSAEALRDLRCLVGFIDHDLKPTMDALKDDSCQKIRFEDLWHIFQPGVEVYAPGNEKVQRLNTEPYQELYRVSFSCNGRPYLSPFPGVTSSLPPKYSISEFKMHCYHLDFDGESFGPVTSDFFIAPFEGERDIRSLEIYPLRFAANRGQIRERLLQRGVKFLEFTTWQHRHCSGTTLVCQPNGCSLSGKMPVRQPEYIETSTMPSELVDDEVIVDFRQTLQHLPEWTPKIFWEYDQISDSREVEDAYPVKFWADDEYREFHHDSFDYIHADMRIDYKLIDDHVNENHLLSDFRTPIPIHSSQLRDEDLILLPERVFACILSLFRYALLKIDDLQPIRPRAEAWTNLKLPHGHKKTVQALVQRHFDRRIGSTDSDENDEYDESDFIRGKGKSLIILLHGAPGVGKTATAECAAKANGKPLLHIVNNDSFLRPEQFEADLRSKFRLAQRWDCVLLLDEADVFLAQMITSDLRRNYLVAALLRVLEYYSGIVFLTTNRSKELDYAFQSHIHVKLYYPPLTEKQTRSIWKMHIKKTLDRKKHRVLCDENGILEFAASNYNSGPKENPNWDARQIRNAFKTALLLAEFEAQDENTKPRGQKPADQEATMVQVKLEKRHFEMATGNFVRKGQDDDHTGREDPARLQGLESDDELSPWPRQPSISKGGAAHGASSQRAPDQLSPNWNDPVDGDDDSD